MMLQSWRKVIGEKCKEYFLEKWYEREEGKKVTRDKWHRKEADKISYWQEEQKKKGIWLQENESVGGNIDGNDNYQLEMESEDWDSDNEVEDSYTKRKKRRRIVEISNDSAFGERYGWDGGCRD